MTRAKYSQSATVEQSGLVSSIRGCEHFRLMFTQGLTREAGSSGVAAIGTAPDV